MDVILLNLFWKATNDRIRQAKERDVKAKDLIKDLLEIMDQEKDVIVWINGKPIETVRVK